jgi:hypothetical protein
VRKKAGFGDDTNSWKIAKVKKKCGKRIVKVLLRIGVCTIQNCDIWMTLLRPYFILFYFILF